MTSAPAAFQLTSYTIRRPGFEFDQMNGTHHPQQNRPPIKFLRILPYEVWSRIFWHLDTMSPRHFALVCRLFRTISEDPHARAGWFMTKYGLSMGLLQAFRMHRNVLTAEVGRLMIASGCKLPRFVVQLVDKEYHRPDRTRRPVSASIFVFFVLAGYKVYGQNSDFKEDDVARFERCLYGSTLSPQESTETVRMLVETYNFVPVRGLGSPVDETVYLVSKLDLNLVKSLVNNGLDLHYINDLIMERVLWRTDVSDAVIQSYTGVGFELTATAIKKGLQMARPLTLEVLRTRVSHADLQRLAEDTVVDIFGPTIRGWNFTAEAIDFLMANFAISETVMETALFRIPGAPADLPDSFPATRCYMKANPCPVWKWVLRQYGPMHKFTMACFDDALSRAAAERDLHALHDIYLDAGVQFRPRHVKILSCRVLHRDMTSNALHLMKVMRSQVISGAREYVKEMMTLYNANRASAASLSYVTNKAGSMSTNALDSLESGHGNHQDNNMPSMQSEAKCGPIRMTPEVREQWVRALKEEIIENEEWDHRMRTTQLEGGPRGGAYRISRPPEDALRFLEEAREFATDLVSPHLNVPPPPPPPMTLSQQLFGRGVVSVSGGNFAMPSGGSGPSSSSSSGKFRGAGVIGGNSNNMSGNRNGQQRGRRSRRGGVSRQNSAPALSERSATGTIGTTSSTGSLVSTSGGGGVGGPVVDASDANVFLVRGANGEQHTTAPVAEPLPIPEDAIIDIEDPEVAGMAVDENGVGADRLQTDDDAGEGQGDMADGGFADGNGNGGAAAGTTLHGSPLRRRSMSRTVDGLSRRMSTWLSAFSDRGLFQHWDASAGGPARLT
ncbi:hypothetical protein HDU76_000642 [Blyttiomyces sp. JEL0837]|nr:hypothetical protein HDU76_000642 [Blyttiomyces sp. JEL0837]